MVAVVIGSYGVKLTLLVDSFTMVKTPITSWVIGRFPIPMGPGLRFPYSTKLGSQTRRSCMA